MKRAVNFPPQGPHFDFGYTSLKILAGDRGISIPLERKENGQLTDATHERVLDSTAQFLGRPRGKVRRDGTRSRRRGSKPVACAVPAGGVSLRSYELPLATPEETAQLVALQVEKDFPLTPQELAWDHVSPQLDEASSSARVTRVTVAAMRQSQLSDYAELLRACGFEPSFRLGALAASRLCPSQHDSWGLLHVGRTYSELLLFEGSQPKSLANLTWGGEQITLALSAAAGLARDQAERVKCEQQLTSVLAEERAEQLIAETIGVLAARLVACWDQRERGEPAPARLFVVGGGARLRGFESALGAALGDTVTCQRPPLLGPGAPIRTGQVLTAGHSAVTLGLVAETRQGETLETLAFTAVEPERSVEKKSGDEPSARPWLLALAGLVLISVALRYADLLWQLPYQREELAHVRSLRQALPSLDAELAFFLALQERQVPYLDALAVITTHFPADTTIDGVSLARSGDVSIDGKTKSVETVNKFRSDLIASGWFAPVVIENQTPVKKRISFRLRARLRDSPPPIPPEPPKTNDPLPPTAEPVPAANEKGPRPPSEVATQPTKSSPAAAARSAEREGAPRPGVAEAQSRVPTLAPVEGLPTGRPDTAATSSNPFTSHSE